MSGLSFAGALSRRSVAGGAAALMLAGALVSAPAVHAAPEVPVPVETAVAVETAVEGAAAEVTPSMPTDPLVVPEVAEEALDVSAENPIEADESPDVVEAAADPVEAAAGTISVVSDAVAEIELGQKITYTSTVTNTGSLALSELVLAETRGVGTTCDTTTIAVGASAICISTYVVTQGDLDNYFVQNTVTGTAVSPAGALVNLEAGGVINDAPKPLGAANLSFVSDAPGNADVFYGQKVTYTVTVTNTGKIRLRPFQSYSASLSAETNCQSFSILPGESYSCTYVHWITDVDLAAGSISNRIGMLLYSGETGGSFYVSANTLTNRVLAAPVAAGDSAMVPAAPAAAGLAVAGNTVAGQGLANTGSEDTGFLLVGGGVLLLAGAGTLMMRRRANLVRN